MFEEIVQLVGKEEGSTSIILAGIHGDEKCGVEALRKILPNIKIKRGRVLFGYGNPRAIEVNQRFTEANLNRMFKNDDLLSKKEKESYEYKRAQFLKEYLNQADVLLDIHASSIPKTTPFVICEKNAKGIIEYLPVSLVVSGFDKIELGGTDYYMNGIGKIGICLESGYKKDSQSIKIAEKGIISFLKARRHIENNIIPRGQEYVRMYLKYYTKTNNFTLSKSFGNFEIVEEGQLVGVDGEEKIKATRRSLILFAHNCEKIGNEAFLLGEKKESLV